MDIFVLDTKRDGKEDELLGEVDVVNVATDLYVVNGFTQHLYGYDKGKYAKPEAIESVLATSLMLANLLKVDLYVPKIGCGRGGLSWEHDVEPIFQLFETYYPDTHTYVCTWNE